MKLIIQLPCFNEAEMLPATLAVLPRELEGFDCVEVMVVDDGSTDCTSATARSAGVDHIVRINRHSGLANAFVTGLEAALKCGADVIVNTDADNQYDATNIPDLVRPILEGKADMVIGARPMSNPHFSFGKRALQSVGTRLVRVLVGADVRDATSGFRALNAHSALKLNVFGTFTYTLESIIQAALNNLRVLSVPVRVNAPTRPSRLFRSNLSYVVRSLLTIISVLLIYRPFRFFAFLSAGCVIPGLVLGVRYLFLATLGEGSRHIHSVIVGGVLLTCGVFLGVIALVAHLQAINRRILEDIRYGVRLRSLEMVHNGLVLYSERAFVGLLGACSIESPRARSESTPRTVGSEMPRL